jgi:hypothetical protein
MKSARIGMLFVDASAVKLQVKQNTLALECGPPSDGVDIYGRENGGLYRSNLRGPNEIGKCPAPGMRRCEIFLYIL